MVRNDINVIKSLNYIRLSIELETHWNMTKNHCYWAGVECIAGVVKMIWITKQALWGTLELLPSTLGKLPDLEVINLAENGISGVLPEFPKGSFPKLKQLNLRANSLN